MIREVITISKLSTDWQCLDLACGHAVPTDDATVLKLQAEAMKNRSPIMVDCKLCDTLIYRLHTRADIRRKILTRKSVQEGVPDRMAALLDEAGYAVAELVLALQPFADCIQYINPEEDDEEWAKFRLLIKDYRTAAKTFTRFAPRTAILGEEPPPERPG